MKKITALVLGLLLSVSCYAVDYGTINDESIQVFIKVFPEYVSALKQYENEGEQVESMALVTKAKDDIDAILSKYDMTFEQFTALLQRVSLGFATAMMQQSGVQVSQFSDMYSDEEMAVLTKYIDQLQEIMQEEEY
ncbi:MAG: hypothetical protein AB1454_11925 [Candidatus Auribacterota bacterium]